MKIRSCIRLAAGLFLWAAFVGCDKGGGDANPLVINPSSTTIMNGQSQLFTVFGGQVLTWQLDNPGWGTLIITAPDQAVYTSVISPSHDATQILHVTSTYSNDPPRTAEAYILHLGAGSSSSTNTTTTTTVTTTTGGSSSSTTSSTGVSTTTTTTASGATTTTTVGPPPPPV